jgi:hypothetical protein
VRRINLSPLRAIAVLSVSLVALTGCTTVSTLINAYGGPVPEATPSVAPTFAPTGLIELAVGDCIDQAKLEDDRASTDPKVDCNEPHDLEVFASLTLDDGDYPAVETLVTFGSKECAAEFTKFVGLDFGISALDFQFYYPTESSWANGDRGVDCLVFDPTQKSKGSLADAKR